MSSDLRHLAGQAVGHAHGEERNAAHLSKVAVQDAGVEEAGIAHQFEEADVIIAVEGRVDGKRKLDGRRLTDLSLQLLRLSDNVRNVTQAFRLYSSIMSRFPVSSIFLRCTYYA